MTDYSKWHDERINCDVFSASSDIGKVASITFDIDSDGCDWSASHDGQYFAGEVPDYCNNWADAGPILDLILKDRVTVSLNRGGLLTGALGSRFNIDECDVWGGNTKRTISICFLMLQAEG